MKARGIIIAPRLPDFPKDHTGNPFTTVGDAVVDCDIPGCGWHAMGPRDHVKKAWDEHYRACHGADRQVGILLINRARQ